ncbi:DNA gyrase subunit A [Microcystis sp. 0824]|nr:DNA gyrase subunit A [Microcystis sp. 0824]
MKKFSPPQMKEVSFPTPHTPQPLSSQENQERIIINQIVYLEILCYFIVSFFIFSTPKN